MMTYSLMVRPPIANIVCSPQRCGMTVVAAPLGAAGHFLGGEVVRLFVAVGLGPVRGRQAARPNCRRPRQRSKKLPDGEADHRQSAARGPSARSLTTVGGR